MEVGSASEAAYELKVRTKPFVLRREKEAVERDLPPKIESVLYADMSAGQRSMYLDILMETRSQVFAAVEKKGIGGATVSILAALMRLRQICNHPRSLPGLADESSLESGKFELLEQILQDSLASGRKILVFCQFLPMLALIKDLLDREQIKYAYLDGATKRRGDVIAAFNEDPELRVFVMSLKAGGTGVNLTAADTVVLYDPWWNPAVEMQAIDRAHRIGQKKTVNVYRLVTADSIEERVMSLKEKKIEMINSIMTDRKASSLALTKKDLEVLFALPEIDR